MFRILHVEFNIPLCRAQIGENQKSSIQRFVILKRVKTSNVKAHNYEKMAVKQKEQYFSII